jgi:hypothetical protein
MKHGGLLANPPGKPGDLCSPRTTFTQHACTGALFLILPVWCDELKTCESAFDEDTQTPA